MKKINYPNVDCHIVIGVEAAKLLDIFVSLHNDAAMVFEKHHFAFDGIFKASNETLSLLSGLSLTKTKKLVEKLTGDINGVHLVDKIKKDGCKSNRYKINASGLKKLESKASKTKLRWKRGYGKHKRIEETTIQNVYDMLSNELLHRCMKKKGG